MPNVLITGCSSGIGRALADAFKAAGFDVWASARRPDDVAALHQIIVARFQQDFIEAELFLAWSAQQLRGEVFANCEVLEERADEEGAFFRVRGDRDTVEALRAQIARA